MPKDQSLVCIDFSERRIIPTGLIELTWYVPGSAYGRKTYKNKFYVHSGRGENFDLIIGSRTIARERFLSWNLNWSLATLWQEKKKKTMPIPNLDCPRFSLRNIFTYWGEKKEYRTSQAVQDRKDEETHARRKAEAARICAED